MTGWSGGGRQLLGWTARETVGQPAAALLVDPPEGFPEGCGTGPDPAGPVSFRHRDGSTVDAVVTVHPLHGPDGRTLGRAMTVQQWGRRPVIADRAFEAVPVRPRGVRPRAAVPLGQRRRLRGDGALRGAGAGREVPRADPRTR
ncbi:PAS domain-containing protein [Kitasatospora sp. RB6PN24]|uniref:PAS domain-containing protein n=1 Tax=Kitasatospora humi TaxID=2893891 RepID=UPI001E34EAA7|nr:PAS domain-containing protein [Kitasatospora humi]MCC9306540.1 PAS domain-containing protein [Kitasatospora humi]